MAEFDRVVAEVIASLCEEDKQWIALMKEADLPGLHHTMGMWIRNKFSLWHTSSLTENWRLYSDGRDIQNGTDCSADHPDAVSQTIIEAVWRQLRRDILHKP